MTRQDLNTIGIAATIALGTILVVSLLLGGAFGQTVPGSPPLPSSYTFTLTPDNVDALYNALERASRMQEIVTGDRSPRWDALEKQIRDDVLAQKIAAAKPAEPPKAGAPKP